MKESIVCSVWSQNDVTIFGACTRRPGVPWMQVSISRTMTDQQSPLLLARELLKVQTHTDMNSSPLQEHPVPGGGAVV